MRQQKPPDGRMQHKGAEREESEAIEAERERLDKSSRISRHADEAEGTGGTVGRQDHSSSSQAAVSKAAILPAHSAQTGQEGLRVSQKSSCPYTHTQAMGNTA